MKLKNEDLYFWLYKKEDPKSTYIISKYKSHKKIDVEYFINFFNNNPITKKFIDLKKPYLLINNGRNFNNFFKEIKDLDHIENQNYPNNWYNLIDLKSVLSIIYVNDKYLYFFLDHVALDGIKSVKIIWDFFKLNDLNYYNKLPIVKKKWYNNLILIQCLKLKRNIKLDLAANDPNFFNDILGKNTVLDLKKKMKTSFQIALGSILIHNLFKNLNNKNLTIGHIIGIDTKENNLNDYSIILLNLKKNDNLESICKNYKSEFKKNFFQLKGNYIKMNELSKIKMKVVKKIRNKIDVCISIGILSDDIIKISDNIIDFKSTILPNISFPYYIIASTLDKEIFLNYIYRSNCTPISLAGVPAALAGVPAALAGVPAALGC